MGWFRVGLHPLLALENGSHKERPQPLPVCMIGQRLALCGHPQHAAEVSEFGVCVAVEQSTATGQQP